MNINGRFTSYAKKMKIPIEIHPKTMNPGASNSKYPNCVALTYYQCQQIIAYGSKNAVVVASSTLVLFCSLYGHEEGSVVSSVAFIPQSGWISSSATDHKVCVWETCPNGWKLHTSINTSTTPIGLSWSLCARQFCVCGKTNLAIYHTNWQENTVKDITLYYEIPAKMKLCSYSNDSRFILALSINNRSVFVLHKLQRGQGVRRIHLSHPTTVNSVDWMPTTNIHQRCCFITVGDDYVVRVWSETCVEESLHFNVVAVIPSFHRTRSAAFITTTTKHISNNPRMKEGINFFESFAFGNGHMPYYDTDFRQSKTPSDYDIQDTTSWILTFDKSKNLAIWELTGESLSTRRTPKLIKLYTIPINIGLSVNDINKFFAFARLENEFSHYDDPKFIGRPVSLSLFIQNRKSQILSTIDISLSKATATLLGWIHGHARDIRSIRICENFNYMITIDESNKAFIWKFDDTDVYDPLNMIQFLYELEVDVMHADWLPGVPELICFNGKDLFVCEIPKVHSQKPSFRTIQHRMNEKAQKHLAALRSLVKFDEGYLFTVIFTNKIYFNVLKSNQLKQVATYKIEYVASTLTFISRLFPARGLPIFYYAQKDRSISVISMKSKDQIKNDVILKLNEDIVDIAYYFPAGLTVITKSQLMIAQLADASTNKYAIYQSIVLDFVPRFMSTISTGSISIAGDNTINIFHAIRNSTNFLESLPQLTKISSIKGRASSFSWTTGGHLVYSTGTRLDVLTKFMDSFFLDVCEKCPTYHHVLGYLSSPLSDYHPAILYPIAVSGKYTLLMEMLSQLYDTYDLVNGSNCFPNHLFVMPDELDEVTIPLVKHLPYEQPTCRRTKSLSDAFFLPKEPENKSKKIPLNQALKHKFITNPLPIFTDEQVEMIINLLDKLEDLLKINKDFADQRANAVARAITLSSFYPIPFELINIAYASQDKKKILSILVDGTIHDVENSGAFYWASLSSIDYILVPISVKMFDESRDLSILLLTAMKRFKAIQNLYLKINDDTRAEFFLRDFRKKKHQLFASKNGYSALKKQNIYIAAAMFILAGEIALAIRLILKETQSYSLGYFIARCFDEGIGDITRTLINEIMIPHAKEMKDAAAEQFFENVLQTSQVSNRFDKRLSNLTHGFFNPRMKYFGEQRYTLNLILPSSNEAKIMFAKHLTFAGFWFLALQMIPEICIFDASDVNDELPQIVSTFKAPIKRSQSTEFSKPKKMNLESDSNTEEDSEQFETPSFNFGFGADKINIDESYSSESESESDYDEELALLAPKSQIISPKDLVMRRCLSIEQQIECSGVNAEAPIRKPAILQIKAATIPIKTTESVSDEADVSNQDSWHDVVVFFEIARLRLERFLEMYFSPFKRKDLLGIEKIKEQILMLGSNAAAFIPSFERYLYMDCQRRCFVARRFMYLTSIQKKADFFMDLCKKLAILPSQMICSKFTSQQITQIVLSIKSALMFMNDEVMDVLTPKLNYITATIEIGCFIFAIATQNVDLMYNLFRLDFSKIRDLSAYLFTILPLSFIDAGKTPYDSQHSQTDPKLYSFLPKKIAQSFIIVTPDCKISKPKELSNLVSSLVDFMVADSFLNAISELSKQGNLLEFKIILISMNKIHDIYLQLLTYCTLAYPSFGDIVSFGSLRSQSSSFNRLYALLLSTYDHERQLHMFCQNIINRSIDRSNKNALTILPKEATLVLKKIACIKNKIFGIAIDNSGQNIMVGTNNSIIEFSTAKQYIEVSSDDTPDDDESLSLQTDVLSGNRIEIEPESTIMYDTIDTKPNLVKITQSPNYGGITAIKKHPTENFSIIGNFGGEVIIKYFNNDEGIARFKTPHKMCSSIACSHDGTVFAATHENEIRYYSLCLNKTQEEPFNVIKTFSPFIRNIEFLSGTGVTAVAQEETKDFKSTLCFYDALLPSNHSLITSLEIGKTASLKFLNRSSILLAGCGNGNVHLIDTRMFEVVKTFKAHTTTVKYMDADENESFLATGGVEGVLKIWDLNEHNLHGKISCHKKKNHIWNGKPKKIGITGIIIRDKNIFTCGYDGHVQRVKICI